MAPPHGSVVVLLHGSVHYVAHARLLDGRIAFVAHLHAFLAGFGQPNPVAKSPDLVRQNSAVPNDGPWTDLTMDSRYMRFGLLSAPVVFLFSRGS